MPELVPKPELTPNDVDPPAVEPPRVNTGRKPPSSAM